MPADSRIPVLIPAAGSIRGKFPFLRPGCDSPALLPVNTRALGTLVLEAFQRLGGGALDLHLFVDEAAVETVAGDTRAAELGCQVHGVPPTRGVIDTLRCALELTPPSAEIIVCLVTTVPAVLPEPGEVLLDENLSTAGEWSLVDTAGDEVRFIPRGTGDATGHAFTGLFRCERAALETAVREAAGKGDLIHVIDGLSRQQPLTWRCGHWLDCGHDANYSRSRAELLASRSFNALVANPATGLVIKRSRHGAKLRDEAAYMRMLPRELSTYFPRLVGESRREGQVEQYEMEYYGYPCLAEYQLHWDLSPAVWQRIYSRLSDVLDAFRSWSFSIGPRQYERFMWGKTAQRLDALEASQAPAARVLSLPEVRVNGRLLRGWPACRADAEKLVTGMYREEEFCASHGDLCFNNILCDAASSVIRLIDPRGSFGEECRGIYGDRRYDLAKLTHSAAGHYDYLVNGLYRLTQSGPADFALHIPFRANQPVLEKLNAALLSRQQADPREIAVLTGLLFLSMTPLHAEDPSRQTAFILRGLHFLNEALS
jgi:Phosphotransferase enzyme family